MNWSYHQTFQKVIRTIGRSFSSPAVFFLIASLSLKLFKQAVLTFLKINPQKINFKNKEGLTDFNFCLPFHSDKEGVSVMLRVKNEEQKIIYCLKSIIDVFDEIIFVDNGSEDSTVDLVTKFKQQYDQEDKIKIYHYPWKIARCGAEHLATAENSVHSLAYYYNWTLSHCSFKYACKWDADMVLPKERREEFKSFLKNKVLKDNWKCWIVSGQTLYRSLDGRYFLSQRLAHERRVFPFSYRNHFFKEQRWEVLRCIPPLPVDAFPGVAFYELKFTNEDELSHWSPQTLADVNNPKDDLKQESERFQLIKHGRYQDDQFTALSTDFLDAQISDINPSSMLTTLEPEKKYNTESTV